MLRRENEIRLSPHTIQEFERLSVQRGGDGWLIEAQRLQIQVVAEFGFYGGGNTGRKIGPSGTMQQGLDLIRCAVSLFPNEPSIIAAANYLRFNRLTKGALKMGDLAPDCTLYAMNEAITPTTLHTVLRCGVQCVQSVARNDGLSGAWSGGRSGGQRGVQCAQSDGRRGIQRYLVVVAASVT